LAVPAEMVEKVIFGYWVEPCPTAPFQIAGALAKSFKNK
jgi:hypothetical protein